MKWVLSEIKTIQNFLSPSSLPRPPPQPTRNFDLNSKITPSILLIIIILSIIFFFSGLLHLLVRFLLTPPRRDNQDYFDNVTALQGQLQQLFHLHDSGVDQSFIDTLPIFHYKSIIGLKNHPFDCSVCLCEFETEDKLRLLPKCSHAFHMECIDTWLLSHSTCPLCRSSLLSDLSSHQAPRSSFLLVLESASDHSSREILENRNSGADDVSHTKNPNPEGILSETEQIPECSPLVVPFAVKLGKFRNIDMGLGSSDNTYFGNSNNLDERRCFSMGSHEYIMDDETALEVHVSTKKLSSKNHRLPGHRTAMSECGFDTTGRLKFSGSGSMRITGKAEKQKRENSESLETKTPSFAKRTMLWFGGRQNKVAHSSSTSNV